MSTYKRPSYIGTGKRFVRYSKEQLEDARQTDMIEFLERKVGFDFERNGSVYVCKQHDSLIIQPDRHQWYWNSINEKGLNVIDWLIKIDGLSVQEAFQTIIGLNGDETTAFSKATAYTKGQAEKEERKEFAPPEKAESCNRAKAYLCSTRCLDYHIVNYCVKNDLIYQDKNYGNVIFAGYDENGTMRFAESKTTNSFSKYRPKNVSGSDKKYSFNLTGLSEETEKDRLYVFEAPVDLLSHATIMQMIETKRAKEENRKADYDVWKKQNRLSLSGCSMVALDSYLERHPDIKKLELCLDNDDAGRTACDSIIAKYGSQYAIRCHLVKNCKDYNECLQNFVARQKEEETTIDNSNEEAVSINNTQRKR